MMMVVKNFHFIQIFNRLLKSLTTGVSILLKTNGLVVLIGVTSQQ
jgi:hypothetical protein